jgi:hypothetical protein
MMSVPPDDGSRTIWTVDAGDFASTVIAAGLAPADPVLVWA